MNIDPIEILKYKIREASESFTKEFGREPNMLYLGQVEVGVLMIANGKPETEGLVEVTGPARMEFYGFPIYPSGRPSGVIPMLIRETDLPEENSPDSSDRI